MSNVETLALLRTTSARIAELEERLRLERLHREGMIWRAVRGEGKTGREVALASGVLLPQVVAVVRPMAVVASIKRWMKRTQRTRRS